MTETKPTIEEPNFIIEAARKLYNATQGDAHNLHALSWSELTPARQVVYIDAAKRNMTPEQYAKWEEFKLAAIRSQPVPVEPERVPYTPEAWAMAEWAIPLHVHPIGVENWDVANCAGDWKPPTPDQVRGYIAQAVYKFQKENINPLNQKIDALRSRLQVAQQEYADCQATLKDERYCHGQTVQDLKRIASEQIQSAHKRAEQAEKDRDACYASLEATRSKLHEITAFVNDNASPQRESEQVKKDADH